MSHTAFESPRLVELIYYAISARENVNKQITAYERENVEEIWKVYGNLGAVVILVWLPEQKVVGSVHRLFPQTVCD